MQIYFCIFLIILCQSALASPFLVAKIAKHTLEVVPFGDCGGICITAARGDIETVLLEVRSGHGLDQVIPTWNLIGSIGSSAIIPLIEIREVSSVQRIVEENQSAEISYLDVVESPRKSVQLSEDKPGESSATVVLVVQIPRLAEPGVYRGSIAFTSLSGSYSSVVLNISVSNYVLPKQSNVKTHLFSIDADSVKYWYGYNELEPDYVRMLRVYADTLSQFRIAPAAFPSRACIKSRELPTPVSKNAKRYMSFSRNDVLPLRAPPFEYLSSGFRLSITVKPYTNTSGEILSYRWFGREAGFTLEHLQKQLNLKFWGGSSQQDNVTRYLSVPWEHSNQNSNIVVEFTSASVRLWINDVQLGELELSRSIEAAYGGSFILGPVSNRLDVYGVNWELPSNGGKQWLYDYFKLEKLIKYNKENQLENPFECLQNEIQNQKQSQTNIIFPIQNSWPIEEGTKKTLLSFARTNGYVKMPFDEATSGNKFDSNIEWAKKIKMRFPGIRIYHSVGSIGGRHKTASQKRGILDSYFSSVDIISMRANVMERLWPTIQRGVSSFGTEISPYIHNTDKVEVKNRLAVGRSFFWKLFANDLDSTTYWNMNLWFQPRRNKLPARFLRRTDGGFMVTSRNWSTITAGTMLYPGENGPLPSLRLFGWLDGLEDFEYLYAAKELARSNSQYADVANSILEDVYSMFRGRGNWYTSSESEYLRLVSFRKKLLTTLNAEHMAK